MFFIGADLYDASPHSSLQGNYTRLGEDATHARTFRETMLATLGVRRDLCAQSLSHGLSGVQVQHCDWHDYMREKSEVLGAWKGGLGRFCGALGAIVSAYRHHRDIQLDLRPAPA